MSYRNPKQVVDTQTSQYYANLQKTIAGSFEKYSNSVKIADAKLQKQNELRAKAERERINNINEDEKNLSKNVAKIGAQYPTINFTTSSRKILNSNGKNRLKNKIPDAKQKAENQSVNNMGETVEGAAKLEVSNQTKIASAYTKARGSMGGIASYYSTEDVEGAYNLTEKGKEAETSMNLEYDGSNNLVPTFTTKFTNGRSITYSPGKLNVPIIMDFQPSVEDLNKQSLNNKNYNFNDPNNLIYKNGKKLKDKDGKVIGVFGNKDVYEKGIVQAVRANIIGSERAFDSINLFNDVLRTTDENGNKEPEIPRMDEWKDYPEDDQSPQAKQQRDYQKRIVDAATKFVANQADILKEPYMYKFSDVPEKNDEPVLNGKDFYKRVQKNPVGLYQEYANVAPKYDREANTITIFSKDVEGEGSENIVYKMNNPTERNEFYLELLRITEAAKGNSKETKIIRKDFEEAMRADTSGRSKIRKEKKSAADKKSTDADKKSTEDAAKTVSDMTKSVIPKPSPPPPS
tara:strand:+ start:732 stop:2282 length:1551 start_codon:yes stop_codon:yes gene_type:complete